jgi:hypothetical protein
MYNAQYPDPNFTTFKFFILVALGDKDENRAADLKHNESLKHRLFSFSA